MFSAAVNVAVNPGINPALERLQPQRKTGNELDNGLADLWKRRRITKKVRSVRRQEIKWELPVKLAAHLCAP
jgi:hypothetical protein